MHKNAIIIHGAYGRAQYHDPTTPSPSNDHWLPWLQKQLLTHDILTATPEMPEPWDPQYVDWCREFERFEIGPQTILVGHSYGGGFVTRWLSEHPDVKVGRVLLVAPSLDPAKQVGNHFFDFTIDPNLAARTSGLSIFGSTNDSRNIHTSVQMIRNAAPGSAYQEFTGYGHFTRQSMGTDAFPEALSALLQ